MGLGGTAVAAGVGEAAVTGAAGRNDTPAGAPPGTPLGGATTGLPGTATTAGGRGAAATGAAVTTGGRAGGGVARATASACRRSRIARIASPGFAAFDRSIRGAASLADAAIRDAEPRLPPPRIYPRTFTASSSSIEDEWVFFSVTPTAVSASRMDLLLTSSSRAKSLIRTLFIRPFSLLPTRR